MTLSRWKGCAHGQQRAERKRSTLHIMPALTGLETAIKFCHWPAVQASAQVSRMLIKAPGTAAASNMHSGMPHGNCRGAG